MNEAGTENSMAASLYPLIRWPQTMAIMAKAHAGQHTAHRRRRLVGAGLHEPHPHDNGALPSRKAAAATPNHRLSTNDVRAETRSSTTEASATSKPTHIHTRSLLLMMRVTGTSPHEKNE